jgi:MazG family protein
MKKTTPLPETDRFLKVVKRLRKECPWDKKQTHKSLKKYLIEEAFEASEAIETGKTEEIAEELGDVLLQVVLHSEIASEKKTFNFESVAKKIADKMISRHPHVFKGEKVGSAKAFQSRWAEFKKKESPGKNLLEGTPTSMPALLLCERYSEKAATVGFDWSNVEQVWEKVVEEVGELKAEVFSKRRNKEKISEELGDLFFALTNLSRHLGINAEACAKESAAKFKKRFGLMEKKLSAEATPLKNLTLAQWDKEWELAKSGAPLSPPQRKKTLEKS